MGEQHRLAAFNLGPRRKIYYTKELCDLVKFSRVYDHSNPEHRDKMKLLKDARRKVGSFS